MTYKRTPGEHFEKNVRRERGKAERPKANGYDVPPPTTEGPDVVDPPSAPDPGGAPPDDPIVERLRQMFDKPTGWVDLDHPPEIAAAMLETTALAVFNHRFAMAFVGKQRYVFDKTKPLHFMSRGEFASAWAGIKVDSRFGAEPKDVTRVVLVKVWLAAIGADRYDEFVFRPNEGQPGGRVWNTAGFFIQAKEGPTPHFDAVMGLLLPDDCEWFLDWLADLVQYPSRVLGTAVCITGPTRAGKSALGNYIGRMLGGLYLLIESTVFAGRAFNAEEKEALLTHYDEAVASDLKHTLSTIKAKITSPTRRIEAKGIDAITIPNPMRYLLTSEHDPVPLMDGGTRSRFAIFAMSSKLKGNRTFWNNFGAEMDGDGPAHLLHRLLNRKISHDLRIAPDTAAARRNAKDHLPALRRWLVESVEEGCFVGGAPYKDKNGDEIDNNAPWTTTATTSAIYDAFVHWWKDRRLREEIPSREALAKMLRSLGCTYQGRLMVDRVKTGRWTLLTPDQMAANIKVLWQIDLD